MRWIFRVRLGWGLKGFDSIVKGRKYQVIEASSAYFSEFLAYNVAASGAEVNLIPAGLKAETTDARACEWSQQYTPHPSSSSHLAAHAGHADVVALGASHFYWIVGVACI